MINHRLISADSADEWNEALSGIGHSFYHTREHCHAMSLTTGYDTYLYHYQDSGCRIVCPIAEREFEGYKDVVTPYGFSGFAGYGAGHSFRKCWKEFMNSRGYICGYISMNPAFAPDETFEKNEAKQNTNLYFLNTSLSLTELFDNLDSNRKKLIKNFRSAESKFIYDKEALTDFFTGEYYSFLKRINASQASYFSKETLEYLCELENVFMVGAGDSEKIEAVYVFGFTPYSGDCLFNVATESGRHFAPLLLWRGLKFLKSKKVPLMNLGGGLKPDDSVALSKERFGAYKLPFVNLHQIYDAERYNMLCAKAGANGNESEGYFPAYRKNNKSNH